jgi:hypothetical protein
MARLGNEDDRLIQAPKLDSQPAFVRAFHVRGKNTFCYLFACVGVRPSKNGFPFGAWANQPLTSKLVEVELLATFQANSLSRSGHLKLFARTADCANEHVTNTCGRSNVFRDAATLAMDDAVSTG